MPNELTKFYNDMVSNEYKIDYDRKEKIYFKKSLEKVIYLDPIFHFLYKPFNEKNMFINKIEYIDKNDKVIKTIQYDKYGNENLVRNALELSS